MKFTDSVIYIESDAKPRCDFALAPTPVRPFARSPVRLIA
jgi:hypothetical protein